MKSKNIFFIKTTLVCIIMIYCSLLHAQNLPFLNASTGNAGQSFTDSDTNLYMYHSNRLEKLDKNLSPIWVNTYNGFDFENLLLSKTKSMYFIGSGDKIGKLDRYGNVVWTRSLNTSTITINSVSYNLSSVSLKQLLLDRNNNLVLTGVTSYSNNYGVGFLLKLDTSGAVLATKIFQGVGGDHFNIISDSIGNYKIYSDAGGSGSYTGIVYNYSQAQDSINNVLYYDFSGTYPLYNPSTKFYKSKFGSNFYIAAHWTYINNNTYSQALGLYKFTPSKNTWYSVGTPQTYTNLNFDKLQEDEKGNLLLSSGSFYINYDNSFSILDSNLLLGFGGKHYWTNMPSYPPATQLHYLYSGKYFFDIIGGSFPSNPLTIADASIACVGPGGGWPTPIAGNLLQPSIFYPKTLNVSTILSPVTNFTATAVTNFSLAQNFCQILGVNEKKLSGSGLEFFPNPNNGEFIIKSEKDETLIITNELGQVLQTVHLNTLNNYQATISNLKSGIYFVSNQNIKQKIVVIK